MTLLLDGAELPGLDHRVTISEQIERKDLSGDTSASAGSHGGWKPAVLSVRVLLDMEKPGDLAALRLLYHTADEITGVPRLYEISEPTAQAMGIHRVRFTDFFKVAPQERERAWEVNFTLIEERTIPERTEARQPEPSQVVANVPSSLQSISGGPPAQGEEGFIEQVLTVLNDQAGKVFFGGGT